MPEPPQKPGKKPSPPAHFAPVVRCAVHGTAGRYLVRVLYVLVSIMSVAFPGIFVYVLLWIIMPRAPAACDSSSSTSTARS